MVVVKLGEPQRRHIATPFAVGCSISSRKSTQPESQITGTVRRLNSKYGGLRNAVLRFPGVLLGDQSQRGGAVFLFSTVHLGSRSVNVQLPGFRGIAYAPRWTAWARSLSIVSLQRALASWLSVTYKWYHHQVCYLACFP